MRAKFNKCLSDMVKSKNYNSVYLNEHQYNTILKEVCDAKIKTQYKTHIDYRRLRRYDVISVGKEKKLISPVTEKSGLKYFLSIENFFDVIHTAHLNTGHGGRNRMVKELNTKYKNITIDAIMLYLSLCEICHKKAKGKKKVLVEPTLTSQLITRCQVDLIDLQTQPDGDYKFVLHYQDHLTKFVILKPLQTKTAVEVAMKVMEVFTTFGAPSILQSCNGRDFAKEVITELTNLWDGIKIIHGEPEHPQSQESMESAAQVVENMILTWLETNTTTKWVDCLNFVQLMKNRSFHDGIKKTPYEALFGSKMKLGLKSVGFPIKVLESVQSEEELTELINTGTLPTLSGNEETPLIWLQGSTF